ncbi:hypothetical protein B9Q00_07500 [Candidatus Marsarchaeota G1 archaeon OSP_C]|uniref:DNA mismatch repair proteins mutS family domain-containing protein n=1 Tax=Candidatus Marsarchaeota G1 archaeon OSP_C TaxID=1978154 RepID=A0A2R6ANC4_9ARCH|nr:MAG: hypothetical protein B9Q00_07500 [Candidatus Marsarchaeota G1 archaeon OSP_C]
MIQISLMYPNKNFDLKEPWNAQSLIKDLELERLLMAMANGDEFIYQVSKVALLNPETQKDTILYRQAVLKDCLNNQNAVRELYDIAVTTTNEIKRSLFWLGSSDNPSLVVDECVRALKIFVPSLRRIRSVAERFSEKFESIGFSTLFSVIKSEFSDEYLTVLETHLNNLKFEDGVSACVKLDEGNAFTEYKLQKPQKTSFLDKLRERQYTFQLDPRDEAGAQILGQMRNSALKKASLVLNEAVKNALNFFNILKTEVAFYLGCLNLYQKLRKPVCFPVPLEEEERLEFRELYDVSLSLLIGENTVGNNLSCSGKRLFVITGANRGGKTTFLRSIGQAQLLMQCGCFVAAKQFVAPVRSCVFTHFKKEEDPQGMVGKLEEELKRMSEIVDHAKRGGLILFNESFSTTNDREGSEIARQIVDALLKREFAIFYVTHLYEFTKHVRNYENAIFLKAERKEDGTRTYKIIEGVPEQTSYAKDLFYKVFAY